MRNDVTERVPERQAERLPRHARVLLWLSRRELPASVYPVVVERGLEVPAADGALMITDHYRPVTEEPCPTLLVRSPYGRGFPWDYIYGALFAAQGFHVVLQSCRGTGGSGGDYEPFVHEAADAQATVAWLRRQDWFNGGLGTIGASYLGYTQWALAADPPPELGAMVVQVGSDDFYTFLYPGGAFALEVHARRHRRHGVDAARLRPVHAGHGAAAAHAQAGRAPSAAHRQLSGGLRAAGRLLRGVAGAPVGGGCVLGARGEWPSPPRRCRPRT